MTAPLETEYAVRPRGRSAEIDDTLTMAPAPARRMAGIACLAARNMLSTLTVISRRQLSSLSSRIEPRLAMPTLLWRRSRRPKRSGVASTIAAQSAARVTSAERASASPPTAAIISTVRLARLASRSTTTTRVPARARRIAAARPLPIPSPAAPPPVTMATFPVNPQLSGTSKPIGELAMAPLMRASASARRSGFYHRRRRPSGERHAQHAERVRGKLVLEPPPARAEPALAHVDRARRVERVDRVDVGAVDLGHERVALHFGLAQVDRHPVTVLAVAVDDREREPRARAVAGGGGVEQRERPEIGHVVDAAGAALLLARGQLAGRALHQHVEGDVPRVLGVQPEREVDGLQEQAVGLREDKIGRASC